MIQDEKLKKLYREIKDEMSIEPSPPPGELISDLLLLLYSQHGHSATADLMWRKITHGRRWKDLKKRIRYISRLCDRQMNKARVRIRSANEPSQKNLHKIEDVTSTVLKFVTKMTISRLMRLVTISSKSVENILNNIAENYNIEYINTEELNKDFSHGLIDTYVLVVVELVHRARNLKTINLWLNHELVLSCLESEYDHNVYKPRQLQVAIRMGDEEEKQPGDFSGIRGITKKIREDQISKILPSAFAPWMYGDTGRRYTLDTVINRSPPCYQHFDTRRPDLKHRILLAFIIGSEKRGNAKPRADIVGKSMAFSLLVNAGLKIPLSMIQTDVAWFEHRENRWNGNSFPLNALSLTSASSESWKNIVDVNRILPSFFARSVAGVRPTYSHFIEQIDTPPRNYLTKALEKHIYQAIFLVVVMREEEKNICLPPASMVFPRFDRKTPTVMVCCTEDSESDSRRNTTDFNLKLKGNVFLDLLSANVAPFPLPEVEPSDLIQNLMTMIIGPVEQEGVKH